MARESYRSALVALRADVVAMGECVLDRLETAIESLATGNGATARGVVDGDDEINDRSLDLEERCIDLLALQQPVASDLRFIAASFKIVTDLERVGDLATNLAEYALAGDRDLAPAVGIADIGRAATALLDRSLEAYADGDGAACRAVARDDDEIDALCGRAGERIVRDLIEREADGSGFAVERLLDDVSRVLLTVRDLERVADHAVNVAARTLYAVESDPELIY